MLAVSEKKQKPEINNDDDDVRPDVFKPWWILHSSFVMSEEKKGLKYEIIFGYDDDHHHFHFWLFIFHQLNSKSKQKYFKHTFHWKKKPDIFKANLLFCFVVEMFAIASKIHTATTTLIRFCWLHGH